MDVSTLRTRPGEIIRASILEMNRRLSWSPHFDFDDPIYFLKTDGTKEKQTKESYKEFMYEYGLFPLEVKMVL